MYFIVIFNLQRSTMQKQYTTMQEDSLTQKQNASFQLNLAGKTELQDRIVAARQQGYSNMLLVRFGLEEAERREAMAKRHENGGE